jgi:hypothetical protein
MIGLICSADDAAAAEEFFQLFKTPWEPWVPGRDYDVVITTTGFVPETDVRLLLIFRSGGCSWDASTGIKSGLKRSGAVLEIGDVRIPVYCGVVTFEETGRAADCVGIAGDVAGLRLDSSGGRVVRLGYDLFQEAQRLLSVGQPPEHALVPTLDLHIDALRHWILDAGVPLVEIPPVPAGCRFSVCLTHDIDFIGIRQHLLDHTMWGFLFRASVGALRDYARGRIPIKRLWRSWMAVLTLPFVYLRLAKDFWLPFEWLLDVEKDLPATYFVIPFKRCPGENVSAPHPERRATAYDVNDIPEWSRALTEAGCELGVHGIDAWHSVPKGRAELRRVAEAVGVSELGIRMHWLLRDEHTFQVLEEAGYTYDATVGYNETPGYRGGTAQVYRPFGVRRLLELPLHIQDGALFFPQRLDLSEADAWELCQVLIERSDQSGGVLTVLWHDRSHAAERFWGGFYIRLVRELRDRDAWFCTAGQAVQWFRARRSVSFERGPGGSASDEVIARCPEGKAIRPFTVRFHHPASVGRLAGDVAPWTDVPWSGEAPMPVSVTAPKPQNRVQDHLNNPAPSRFENSGIARLGARVESLQ